MIVTQSNNVFECTLYDKCCVMLIGNDWHCPAKYISNVLYMYNVKVENKKEIIKKVGYIKFELDLFFNFK